MGLSTFCRYGEMSNDPGSHRRCAGTNCDCTCHPKEAPVAEFSTAIFDPPTTPERARDTNGDGLVACPQCAKRVKPNGLGIHRKKAHGTPGKTAAARREAPPEVEEPTVQPDDQADELEFVLEEEYPLTVVVDGHERDVLDALGFLEGHGDATGYVVHWLSALVADMADESDVKLVLTARRAHAAETT